MSAATNNDNCFATAAAPEAAPPALRQPVHPRLARHLLDETERLRRCPRWASAPLSDTLHTEVVLAALRALEGRGEPKRCLDPWRASELTRLQDEGSRLVHFFWKRQANWEIWDHYERRKQGRAEALSLDALPVGVGEPSVPEEAGRDLLQTECAQSLLALLGRELGLPYPLAIVVTLDLLSGETLPTIHRSVTEGLGLDLPSYETLRKQVARARDKIRPRLREECLRWDIARPSPETSPEVSGDAVSGLPVNSFAVAANFRHRPALPTGERRKEVDTMDG